MGEDPSDEYWRRMKAHEQFQDKEKPIFVEPRDEDFIRRVGFMFQDEDPPAPNYRRNLEQYPEGGVVFCPGRGETEVGPEEKLPTRMIAEDENRIERRILPHDDPPGRSGVVAVLQDKVGLRRAGVNENETRTVFVAPTSSRAKELIPSYGQQTWFNPGENGENLILAQFWKSFQEKEENLRKSFMRGETHPPTYPVQEGGLDNLDRWRVQDCLQPRRGEDLDSLEGLNGDQTMRDISDVDITNEGFLFIISLQTMRKIKQLSQRLRF